MKFEDYKAERLNDSEFRKEYEAAEGEYLAMRAVYRARKSENMTQQELSKVTHIPQKTISNIETGTVNTSVNTLAKIAQGLGKQLKIEFV